MSEHELVSMRGDETLYDDIPLEVEGDVKEAIKALERRPPSEIKESKAANVAAELAFLDLAEKTIKERCERALQDIERRREGIRGWWGPALLKFAQKAIGRKKPRRLATSKSVIHLRKRSRKLEEVDRDAFRQWCFKNGRLELLKLQAHFQNLSGAEYDELMELAGTLPEHLGGKLRMWVEIRKTDTRKLMESLIDVETGEVREGVDEKDIPDGVRVANVNEEEVRCTLS